MSYLGNQPAIGKFTLCDDLTPDGSTTTFSLTSSSNAVVPGSVNAMLVSINGVIQAPATYSINGSQIIFSTAPGSGDVIDQIRVFGSVLNVGTVSDGTITTAKIIDSAVTTAKLNDASVSLAKLTATGTKDATTFLRGDNTFASAGITEADQWRLTTSFTGDANPIASNWERTDTSGWGNIGTGMTESSGIFTFPSTGVYLVSFNFYGSATTAQLYVTASIEVTTNNSSYAPASYADTQFYGGTSYNSSMSQYFVDVTDVANVKVRFVIDAVGTSTTTIGSSTNTGTGVTFIRLGAT